MSLLCCLRSAFGNETFGLRNSFGSSMKHLKIPFERDLLLCDWAASEFQLHTSNTGVCSNTSLPLLCLRTIRQEKGGRTRIQCCIASFRVQSTVREYLASTKFPCPIKNKYRGAVSPILHRWARQRRHTELSIKFIGFEGAFTCFNKNNHLKQESFYSLRKGLEQYLFCQYRRLPRNDIYSQMSSCFWCEGMKLLWASDSKM